MNKFFEALANVFRIPDLRKRVLFTLGLLAIYRVGAHVPTPGIDYVKFEAYFTRAAQSGFLGYFDLFSGGNVRRMTIFALGITPYITASIILQLLTVVIPTLEKLQKEGELGRRKITQWTRYLTIDPSYRAVVRYCRWPAESMTGRLRHQSGLRLYRADHHFAHRRHGLYHVAGRADYRSRHWQRHVADHLYRHRGGSAATPSRNIYQNTFVTQSGMPSS